MPFQIIRQDITKLRCDAIVNAANHTLLGGGGVDGMIHRAAGPELLRECRTLHGCETGKAKLTKGYALPCRWVIHTVGPIWQGGAYGEEALLGSCYRESLALAAAQGCRSVAFPLISAGAFGYPRAEALRVAAESIRAFLEEHEDMTVWLTVYGRGAYLLSERLYSDVRSYINDNYVSAHTGFPAERRRAAMFSSAAARFSAPAEAGATPALAEALRSLDESFSQMLLRKIDERGMKDSQCYKRANVDRKLFSKIRGDVHYRPSKSTALAFAVALELPLEETRKLLETAGYALSHSSKFDVIVEYFIRERNYNIDEINAALFDFDQALLGSASL
ncbi:MAG: macro domain-containing protein [Oscillospiraceae bacterium]|nr:macro domain-containing protein [Oscillospiraceae bacterium]